MARKKGKESISVKYQGDAAHVSVPGLGDFKSNQSRTFTDLIQIEAAEKLVKNHDDFKEENQDTQKEDTKEGENK